MPTQETIEGRTPNGGVRSVAYYRDEEWNAVEKDKATWMEIVEFDKDGKEIQRTHGRIGNTNE